jgi:TolA-binding protein
MGLVWAVGLWSATTASEVRAAQRASRQLDENEIEQATALFNTATNAQNDGQFELAAQQWEELLSRFPTFEWNWRAHYYCGICYVQVQQHDKAIAHFNAYLTDASGSRDKERQELVEQALLHLGFCQYTLGRRDATDDNERQPNEWLEKATATFQRQLKDFATGPFADQAQFFLGEALYHSGNLADATRHYAAVVDGFPKSAMRESALYALIGTLIETGEHDRVRQAGEKFLAEFPNGSRHDDVALWVCESLGHLAAAADEAGDSSAAAELYQQAARQLEAIARRGGDAAQAQARYQLAGLEARRKNWERAAELFAEVAADSSSPRAADAALEAGRALRQAGNADAAAAQFIRVIAAGSPRALEATHWLARTLLEQDRPAEALKAIDPMIGRAQGQPWEVPLALDRADALYASAATRLESIDAYLKIALDHPEHELAPQALYNAAFGCQAIGRYQDAVRLVEQFTKAYGDHLLKPDVMEVAAEAQLATQDFAGAKKSFTNLLNQFPNHANAQTWVMRAGLAQFVAGDYEATIKWIGEQLREPATDAIRAEADYLVGASYFRRGDFARAREALARSVAADVTWRSADETALLLARTVLELGDTDEALTIIDQLQRRSPQSKISDEIAYRLAEIHYARKDFEEAEKAYRRVIESDSEIGSTYVPYALYGSGWAYLDQRKYDQADERLTQLIDQFPEHALLDDALVGRGMARRLAGRPADAIADLDRYLKLVDEADLRASALYERGLAEVALKDWPRAIATLESLAASAPSSIGDKVLYELAWAYKSADRTDDAARAFARLAQDYPASPLNAEAQFQAAQQLYSEEQFEPAAAAYERVLAAKPSDEIAEKAAYKLGWAYFKNADYEQSLAAFRGQVQSFPDGALAADGKFMISESLMRLERHADAVTAYKIARPAVEASGEVTAEVKLLTLLHGAQAANRAKDYETALDFAEAILEDFPDSSVEAEAWYEIGEARKGQGSIDEAIAAWTEALESLGKTGARARSMIGEALFEQRKYDEAIKQFQLVVYGYGGAAAAEDIRPWQAFAAYEAARCSHVQAGETDNAEQREKLLADARRMFQYLIDNYPNESLAQSARKQLDRLTQGGIQGP